MNGSRTVFTNTSLWVLARFEPQTFWILHLLCQSSYHAAVWKFFIFSSLSFPAYSSLCSLKIYLNCSYLKNEQNIQFYIYKFLPPPGFEPGSLGTLSTWLIHYVTVPHDKAIDVYFKGVANSAVLESDRDRPPTVSHMVGHSTSYILHPTWSVTHGQSLGQPVGHMVSHSTYLWIHNHFMIYFCFKIFIMTMQNDFLNKKIFYNEINLI